MIRKVHVALVSLLALCLLASGICAPSLRAQTTYGQVTGTVTDQSGAAIADAQVTLTNVGTTEKRTQSTGADGVYIFVNLIPGKYRVDAEKAGFKRVSNPEVIVEVGQTARIDLALQVGAQSETVEVTAITPLLQPETSSLGQVVEERKANELPLNGRNVFSLITLAPSVVPQGSAGSTPVGVNPFGWGNYQVNGSFGNQSAEYLDGQPLNIGYINLPVVIPTQDSIQEFKVQTSNLGADWGKFSGGVINLSTKSGTNGLHGEAYEYLRNKVLDANDFFLNKNHQKRPPFTQNQFGANAGGPLIIPHVYDGKDKTFWFFSWEGFRLRTGTAFTTTVPTAAERAGDFRAITTSVNDPCGGTVDPSGNGAGACPGSSALPTQFVALPTGPNGNPACANAAGCPNVIPTARLNATSLALLKYFPMPNVAGTIDPNTGINTNNFVTATSGGGNQNQVVGRMDHAITSNQHIFFRYTYWNVLDLPVDPLGTGLCADRCAEKYDSTAPSLGYNYTLTPTTIIGINASLSRFAYNRSPKNSGFDLTTIGWPAQYNAAIPSGARTPPTPCVFQFTDNIMCTQGQSFITDRNTQWDFSPNVTLVRGKHTVKLGFQLEIGRDNYAQTNVASGSFAFCGSGLPCFSSFPFADFLLGYADNPSSVENHFFGQAVVPALVAGQQIYRAFYVDDTFRLTNKLTLNLGLRYELQGPWSERFNRQSQFDPNAVSWLANPAVSAGLTTCVTTAGLPCGLSGLKGDVSLVSTSQRTNIPLPKDNVSPRIGFAYSWDSKTVIRGGYGIFWIPNYVSFGLNPNNDFVNDATTSYTGTIDGKHPVATINFPFQPEVVPPVGRTLGALPTSQYATQVVQNFTIADRLDHPAGYVQQWNLNIQRNLPHNFFVSAAYVGSKGTHLQLYDSQIDQIGDNFLAAAAPQCAAQSAAIATYNLAHGTNFSTRCSASAPPVVVGAPTVDILQSVANPFFDATTKTSYALSGPTTTVGQLDRPFPQFTGLKLAGQGNYDSTYHSLQLTAERRFANAGSLLVAYTNSKLISNADTLTNWLEAATGSIQDFNNLHGERSLSSQDVSQRLVISYVLDLPFGHGKQFMSDATGVMDKLVGGWGIDGVTTFQKGFPLVFSNGNANYTTLYAGGSRPDRVAGCSTSRPSGVSKIDEWFNTACFVSPADFVFGDESRTDPKLRGSGVNNWDFALFKRTRFGPDEKLGLEFRTEFFNLFNRTQFAPPNTSCCAAVNTDTAMGQTANANFGKVTSTYPGTNPRLIQFGLKFLF